jgi:adenylate cyclase
MPAVATTEPRTVLLVDDDAEMRALLVESLSTIGLNVVCAESAEQALGIVQTVQPDLILSDVHMAGMTGIELCRRLKADARFQLTPIVLITAVSDLASRVAGLEAGADDFFGKPFEMIELRTRITSLLRIKRLQDDLATKNMLLQTLFERYMSEQVAAAIVSDPARYLDLTGEKREVTILFGDLRGFTPLADGLDPHDVVEILNVYLSHVVDCVFEVEGTLDKFRGDGVMAIFGAPVRHDDDAARAVRCALRLQEQLREVRFSKFPDLRLHMGIGINTGLVVAGTIGSDRRMDYTVIGGDVNLAQRFEANAGPGQILITDTTYARVRDVVRVRELGALRVQGKREAVPAYDVIERLTG